jgi:hypothetical protein
MKKFKTDNTMENYQIKILSPNDCSPEQLRDFLTMVLSGGQVQAEGLADRIASAALLGFAFVDGKLAGVASIKNQKRSYVISRFLKAKVPRLAEHYDHEIGYAVTDADFRRMGISRNLILKLIEQKPQGKFYATTKNDDMRSLLTKLEFVKTGSPYKNADDETLDLFTFGGN